MGRLFHYIQANKDRKNPTKEMLASREFYEAHTKEIKHVCALLEDEESVKVYKAMWKFRRTHNYKDLPKFEEEKQYFGYDFFKYQEDEKLIDCGAYDGDTIDAFERCMKGHRIKRYSTIAFEADRVNCEYIGRRKNVEVINKGVWNKEATLFFEEGNETGGRLIEDFSEIDLRDENVVEIPVCMIDDTNECDNATILKMDIEGAEWEALHGAERLIRNRRPKLAICIYHSDEDMIIVNDINIFT